MKTKVKAALLALVVCPLPSLALWLLITIYDYYFYRLLIPGGYIGIRI